MTAPSPLTLIDKATTEYVFSDLDTSLVNQDVTFTFVAINGTTPGTGTVQFFSDGQFIGGDNVFGTGSVTVDFLPVGPHVITAVYWGGNGLAGGTFTLTPNESWSHQLTRFSTFHRAPSSARRRCDLHVPVSRRHANSAAPASVRPAASSVEAALLRPGPCRSSMAATEIGTAQILPSNGVVSITTNTLSIGSHTITAVYSGDGNYQRSPRYPWMIFKSLVLPRRSRLPRLLIPPKLMGR